MYITLLRTEEEIELPFTHVELLDVASLTSICSVPLGQR